MLGMKWLATLTITGDGAAPSVAAGFEVLRTAPELEAERRELDRWLAGERARRVLMVPFGGPLPGGKAGLDMDGEYFDSASDLFGPRELFPMLHASRERLVDWHHDEFSLPPDAPGYDLLGAFVGSEGTLGVATKVWLRVVPSPETVRTMVAFFDHTRDAGEAVSEIVQGGVVPGAIEMMDAKAIEAAEQAAKAGFPMRGAALLVELDGSERECDARFEEVTAICERNGATSIRIARDDRFVAATVSAQTAEGHTLGQAIEALDGVAARVLPESFSTDLAGQSRDFMESSSSLFFAFLFALLLIYLVLSAQFESFVDPFIILFAVPLGLIGVLLAALVNIFLASSALQFAISVIGVIVFVGLTAYDTQRIKEVYYEADGAEVAAKKSIMGALSLYLDFINLFVMLMQLLGVRRD